MNKYCKVMDDLEMKNNHGDAHVTHRNWLFYGNDMANGTLFRFMQAINKMLFFYVSVLNLPNSYKLKCS